MTSTECGLWEVLQGKKLAEVRFRPQHPLGQFVLDFYCPAARLVIEVDGDVHDLRQEEDAARTQHLETFGHRVIRFRNEQITQDLPSVLRAIQETVQARLSDSDASGSPRIGG